MQLLTHSPGLLGSIHLCRRLPHQQSIEEEEEEEQPFLEVHRVLGHHDLVHQVLGMDTIGNPALMSWI